MANIVKYIPQGDTEIQGGLKLTPTVTANVPTPASGVVMFRDSANNNKLCQKDSTGAVIIVGEVPVTKVLYVDGNRTDVVTADGSESLPFATIAAATAVATTGMLIKVMHGTYAENVVLPDGVSIEGYASNKTIINGNLTTTASSNMSIRYIQVIGNNTVTLNSPTELIDDFITGAVIVNNVVIQSYNTFITPSVSGVVPLTINGASAKHQHFLSTIAAVGSTQCIVVNNGTLIFQP